MLSHLKDTYMDSMLYGFKRAKGVHGKILTAIEDGKVSWHEPQAIAKLRKVHAQRPLTLAELEEQQKENNKIVNIAIRPTIKRMTVLIGGRS
jgi:hypothetical protein